MDDKLHLALAAVSDAHCHSVSLRTKVMRTHEHDLWAAKQVQIISFEEASIAANA
jgi:hypothetical protein